MMSGGEGRGGEGGWVKKCFLSLRQTALLSAEGKKLDQIVNSFELFCTYRFTCSACFFFSDACSSISCCLFRFLAIAFTGCSVMSSSFTPPSDLRLGLSKMKKERFKYPAEMSLLKGGTQIIVRKRK
jgi:hypothetical protein